MHGGVHPLKGRAALVTAPENRLGKVTRAMMFVNLVYCAKVQAAQPIRAR